MASQMDYLILRCIPSKNSDTKGVKKGNGTTVDEIIHRMEEECKQKVSKAKVYRTLSMFKSEGIIEEGLSYGVCKSYVITEKGFSTLLDIFGTNQGDDVNE